ncbi:MAG: LysR family transcriptional regulator [Rhodobacteraceae bacterium]|nr:LysR family transcriptional regulator [Paracoccaceae bacterium]
MRFVLAVVEAGSVSGAARHLGVNHATVLRRVAAFEARHGADIFERSAQGYTVRPDRLAVIEAAREVSNAVHSVERLMSGFEAPLTGDVRITSTDSICQLLLPGIMAGLRKTEAGLRVALVCANSHLNLSRMEAQVTVRPAERLGEDLVGEQAALMGFAVYGSKNRVRGWLGLGGMLARTMPAKWLSGRIAPEDITAVADSFLVLGQMAACGGGRVVLPCFVGDQDLRLQRLEELPKSFYLPVWVACHEELIGVARIRAVRRHLVQALGARADLLAGLLVGP